MERREENVLFLFADYTIVYEENLKEPTKEVPQRTNTCASQSHRLQDKHTKLTVLLHTNNEHIDTGIKNITPFTTIQKKNNKLKQV